MRSHTSVGRACLILVALIHVGGCAGGSEPEPRLSGTVTPSFLVTHVIYATLANATVEYDPRSDFGPTTSLTRSFRTAVAVEATAQPMPISAGSEVRFSSGRAWGSTRLDATDLTLQRAAAFTKRAPADAIDHGDDEIWFLAQPTLNVDITGTAQAPGKVRWQLAGDPARTLASFVYVRELRDPSTMRAEVRALLERAGVTPDHYPALLAADPFADGSTTIDAERFALVLRYPFIPRLRPGDPASFGTSTFTRPAPSFSVMPREVSYAVPVTASGDQAFQDLFGGALSAAGVLTWSASTNTGAVPPSTAGVTSAIITVGQPEFGYQGRTILSVYFDKIWKTYLFAFDF